MALKRRLNLRQFDNVTVGQRALTTAFIGPRYHGIFLEYRRNGVLATEAQVVSDIEEVVIKLNSIEQIRVKPERLIAMEKAYNPNWTFQNGFLPIYFTDRTREGMLQQEATAIGTLGIQSFEIEVKIAAGAVTPSLKAHALVDDVSEAPNLIRKISERNLVINSTGDFKESLDRRGISWRGLHLFETTNGDILNVRLQYEGQEIVNHSSEAIEAMFESFGYSTVAKQVFVPLDHGVNGDALKSQILQGNGQYRDASHEMTLNMGAAANVILVEDFYGLPNV